MKTVLFSILMMVLCIAQSNAAKSKASHLASGDFKCAEMPEGGMDPDGIIKQIEAASYCEEAASIAESCGFGSSLDVSIAGTAEQKCEKETAKLGKSDKKLKEMMSARCGKICNPQKDGTLCQSTLAYCRMNVAKFIYTVNQPGN